MMERPESSGTMLATGSFGVTANGTIGAVFQVHSSVLTSWYSLVTVIRYHSCFAGLGKYWIINLRRTFVEPPYSGLLGLPNEAYLEVPGLRQQCRAIRCSCVV